MGDCFQKWCGIHGTKMTLLLNESVCDMCDPPKVVAPPLYRISPNPLDATRRLGMSARETEAANIFGLSRCFYANPKGVTVTATGDFKYPHAFVAAAAETADMGRPVFWCWRFSIGWQIIPAPSAMLHASMHDVSILSPTLKSWLPTNPQRIVFFIF